MSSRWLNLFFMSFRELLTVLTLTLVLTISAVSVKAEGSSAPILKDTPDVTIPPSRQRIINVTCHTVCNCSCSPPSPNTSLPSALTPALPSPTPTPRSPPVHSGFALQPRVIYKFFSCNQARSWPKAAKTCEEEGAFLAVPKTMSEIHLLVGMLSVHRNTTLSCLLHIGYRYTDELGKFQSVQGEFMNDFMVGQWAINKPDYTNEDDLCVVLDQTGYLSNEECDEPQAFVCQLKE